MSDSDHLHGCGCDCGCDRRDFLAATGLAAGSLAFTSLVAAAPDAPPVAPSKKEPAVVRAVFLYPPTKTFADNPNGWWSWPGNDFDAEGRPQQSLAAFRDIEKRLGMKIDASGQPVASTDDADRVIKEIQEKRPDGLLLVMFYNRSLAHADLIF